MAQPQSTYAVGSELQHASQDPKDALPFTTLQVDSRSVPASAQMPPSQGSSMLGVLSLFGIILLIILSAITLGYVIKIDDNDDSCDTEVVTATNYSYTHVEIPVCLDGRHNALIGPKGAITGENVCEDQRVAWTLGNVDCIVDNVISVLEQAGANVTKGYQGTLNTSKSFGDAATNQYVEGGREPITDPYWYAGLCPVNVHWHLGTEHLSVGEYDESGTGPGDSDESDDHRRKLHAEGAREGYKCHYYDSHDETFTKEYDWQHCVDMHVGYTYEVHWPHSKAGACGTPNQYQTPFYDGVFCRASENDTHTGKAIIQLNPQNTWETIGVQGQVFTIVNDERYYYPDLIRGMIVDGERGTDIAYYTGSTTGTSRDNQICSYYTPITWQVDRKCGLISASSFDKMCADMMTQRDDMSDDLYPHGARELVADYLAGDNQQK